MKTYLFAAGLILTLASASHAAVDPSLAGFRNPPRELSVMPFWFWNDDLRDDELRRQIADFEAHGVYGFVIHPRIGLPEDIGWLSPRMIHAMHVAVDEAARRKMYVILYDEGMYPSGSSAGQVVARNPEHAARGLAKIDLKPGDQPRLPPGWKLLAVLDRPGGQRVAVVDRPSGGVIRGLHYRGEGTRSMKEETPPAADILNPDAVASFTELVYDRYAREFGAQFVQTIPGIFTDEPSPMGRGPARGLVPGSARTLKQVSQILGYDFTPYLADLWYADAPESARRRRDYHRAIHACFAQNYYRPLSQWCARHGIALMGHPGGSADIGMERYFQVPGQDLVWRMVVPGPKALEGLDSTTAKCASSAMIHLGRRRNSNELYGAYGHELTFAEVGWLAHWCFVRGHNLLYPHAFYYSIRGPRFDERPPDVGPNAAWWDSYRPYADRCRRLSWINTDSRHVCELAILGESDWLPWDAAKVCYQHQRDFNYLELRDLWEDAKTDADGVRLATMHYRAVILDGLPELPAKALPALERLASAGRLLVWGKVPPADAIGKAVRVKTPAELVTAIDRLVKPDLVLQPAALDVRYRHVIKDGRHFYMLFNEGGECVTTTVRSIAPGQREWLDPTTGRAADARAGEPAAFRPYEMKVLAVGSEQRPRLIVAFGDSITAKRGSLKVYATLIEGELAARGRKVRVVNAGIGGNTTEQAKARFATDVLGQRPDAVVIFFGANDAAVDVWRKPPATGPRVARERYEANLREFCRVLKDRGAKPILVAPPPFRWTPAMKKMYGHAPYLPDDPDGFNVLLAQYAESVRKVAREEGVALADAYAAFQAYGRKPGQSVDELLSDGMHPNAAGQLLLADLLLPLLGEAPRQP